MQTSHGSRRTTWPCSDRIERAVPLPQPVGPAAREVRPIGLAASVLLGAIAGYKLLLSPLFSGYCRFHPSCADYSAQAIRLHGAWRGLALTARRLGRCRPLGGHGFDPVPHA
jgi:putative membrane protein insertion efficiency factor